MLPRGISPYVASILLTMIILVFGTALYLNAMHSLNERYQAMQRELLRAQELLGQSLSVISSYIDPNNTLRVFLSVGRLSVKVLDVYINNTLASNACIASFENYSIPITSHPLLPSLSVVAISCNLSVSATNAFVKIVYMGGEVETYAQKLVP